MSYLVLHMDKFKKEAIRGIQSHNRRERESHSNPDIDYDRSSANYELHESASTNYAEAIQRRIDALQLAKAVGSVKNFSHFLKMQKARQSVKVFVLT